MGDAQSAQREGKKDAAAEEESGKVDDALAEQNIEDKPLKNNGQISEINGKADSSIAEVNGHREDEITAEAILSPGEDVSKTAKPLEEETPIENVEINEKESPDEVDTNEEVMTEMDAKQNDINESFRRFFSNIGLKLTVKRGSSEKAEIPTDVPDETNKEESNQPEDIEDMAKETKSDNVEQNIDLNAVQETYDNDSTTCPTLTDVTSEDVRENAEEKTTEVQSDNVDTATPVDEHEKVQQDATLEEDLNPASPSSSEAEVVSPIKKFFTTGIFSGLRKKKKPTENETTEKELVDMGKKETVETTEKTVQQDKEKEENELKEEILSATSAQTTDDGKSPPSDPSTITVNEPEITSSQEKVQASPLKRLLSGSSLKKHSKKQRGRKSSDAKLSDSGEHFSDQVMSSTESAENQKEESPAQPTVEAAGEEDGAWASFKKLVTPKKRMKKPSTNEETQIPASVEETKPSEGEQLSDHSTEEDKKRKDSSVSWEAVLCGSGRRRSRGRKTSDSEDETPQAENDNKKQESPLESSNEVDEILASSPKQAGSPSEGDGGSTWKSLKKLVTPKRKAKDEEESKDNIQSDSEVTQDDPSFSIKKLLPGRKKRKSAEKQDQVSSDEADKEVVSGDEDSETPAVVPLSEFDAAETGVHVKTQADVECHVPKEADYELQQDLIDQMAEQVPLCDSLETEAKVQNKEDTLEIEAPTAPASNEEPEDLTELISKHQQLSDIPEEGVITETMATPASVTEEAARDDTIAEDLIEITSEAITAPEPVDITLADETEMISAVSQLSESSKTSGNTTPVPVEYDVKDTEAVLHQVVETISISPKAIPVCSDEVSSERIAGSVSHQILETFEKEEPTILEMHRRSDATAINTGLNVEEMDIINKLAATVETESINEVKEAISTEIVSKVPTEEFDTAKAAVDEVHEVSVSDPEESIKEIQSTDERQNLLESQSQVIEAVSLDTSPEGDEIVADEGSLVGANLDEKEPLDIDSQEAESATTIAEESQDGGVEQEVQTLTENEDQVLQNITDQVQVEDKDQPPVEVEKLQELPAVQTVTLDSEDSSVQLLEKEVISEEIPAAETVIDKAKEETEALTEGNVEAEEENELQADAAKNEHVEEPEVLEVKLDSEEAGVQLSQEEVPSEDIPAAETVTDETKQATENLSVEPENKELKIDTPSIDHHQVAEVLEAVQVPTLDSEEGSVQSLEKEVISEATLEEETVTDAPKEETEPPTEVSEPVDASETEHVQEVEVLEAAQEAKLESEEDNVQSLEKVVISEEIPPAGPVTGELTQATEGSVEPEEKLLVEDAKAEHVQEQEVLPSDVNDIVAETETEVKASIPTQAVTESVEEGSAQELEKQILSEDAPKPASVTEETENEVVAEESTPQDVQVRQEDQIPEVVDELQTLTAIHVSSVNEEESSVQVREKTEVTSAPCVDDAAVINEPTHELQLSAVQASVEVEKESELPGAETKSAAVEHAIVAEVTTCYLKEVSAAIPDVLIEKTSDVHEPLIDSVASEQEFKRTIETTTPLVKDDVTETAEEGSAVMMINVPSVQFEDNHRIQVQVVDVEIRSAEPIVDTVLEVGVTETKEVIDVCHETVKVVDTLSATSETEENLIHEENKVTIQEVIHHVKETLPETVPESELDNLEQEVIKQPAAVTEPSEIAELSVVEDQKVMEDSTGTSMERQDEAHAVISDDSVTGQQVFKDLTQAPDIPGGEDALIHDRKEDLEEPKPELEKPEADVTTEEVKLPSSELDVNKINEEAQISQISQSQIVTPSNTGLVVPQNTGIISSIGNVESPSSLSLEFKLNIQFGQAKAPASPPPTTERIEPVKKTDVSEVGIQAVEPEEKTNLTQSAESQKQAELTEVAVQATEITEPEPAKPDSTERAVIMNQPVLLDVGMQAVETVQPVEQIKSTERVTPNVQATETVQTVRQTEKREVFLSQPVLSEACDPETKAEEPVRQTEEENEQDVWMDAEEDIYARDERGVSLPEVQEPLEHQAESEQEEKAVFEQETEIAPNAKPEEEGGQQEMIKTEGTCEIESEGEDFAVALEHPETATTSVTTMEWD